MAPRKSNAAHIESLGESMTAEETSMMDANRDGDNIPQDVPEAPAPVVEQPQPELELQPSDTDGDLAPEMDATGKKRMVDYGAFHSERERRKATAAELATAKETIAKFNGRMEVLQQVAQRTQQPQQTAQPQTIEIPDINVDPVGHFQAKNALAEQKIAKFETWQQTQEANATAMNNVRQLTDIALRHENEFSQKTPDYQEAAKYVRAMRDQELQHMGYADAGVRNQIIQQDALQIAAQALQGNLNAAEVVYNIAKARGYAMKAAAPTPAPAPAPASPDARKIATVAKGQAEASSLSQVPGGAMPELTVEAILAMPESEFAKWATDDNFRKIMGG